MQASASLVNILEGYVGGQEVEVTTAHEWQGNPTALVRYVDHVEAHLARPGGVSVASRLAERVAVISQDRVDAVRHGLQQVFQELPRCPSISLVDQLRDRELAGAVDADEQVKFAFGGLHLGDIHVEEADRIALEALALRPMIWPPFHRTGSSGCGNQCAMLTR